MVQILGIIKEGKGSAVHVLSTLGLEMEDLRKRAAEFYLYKNDGKASDRLLDALDNYN